MLSEEEQNNKWHNDPNNWVWGIFYYNKEDKRVFSPKRIPAMGWTVNFANPLSVLLLILMLAAISILVKFA